MFDCSGGHRGGDAAAKEAEAEEGRPHFEGGEHAAERCGKPWTLKGWIRCQRREAVAAELAADEAAGQNVFSTWWKAFGRMLTT